LLSSQVLASFVNGNKTRLVLQVGVLQAAEYFVENISLNSSSCVWQANLPVEAA